MGVLKPCTDCGVVTDNGYHCYKTDQSRKAQVWKCVECYENQTRRSLGLATQMEDTFRRVNADPKASLNPSNYVKPIKENDDVG